MAPARPGTGTGAAARVLAVLLLLGLEILQARCESLFEAGSEANYTWHAQVWTGTRLPSHVLSQWEIRATVRVQGLEGAALIQVANLSTSLSNGEVGAMPPVGRASPVRDSPLLAAFMVKYAGGRVAGLELLDGQPVWALNMQRALASLLQLDLGAARDPSQLVVEIPEETIHGKCKVKYIISTDEEGQKIRKFTDHKTCDSWTQENWSNMMPFYCTSNTAQSPLTSHSEAYYVLSPERGGRREVRQVTSSGILLLQPFQANAELQYMQVSQSLNLESTGRTEHSIERQGSTRSTGVAYQHDEHLPLDKEAAEKTCAKVMSLLERIALGLGRSRIEPEPGRLHDRAPAEVLQLLGGLDYATLEQLYNSVFVGTSYEQETMGNLLLELLPQVGTGDALLFTFNLVKDRKVTDWTAIQMLMALPFYLRQPSLFRRHSPEEMITACEPMLSLAEDISPDVQQTSILTFASLINKMCLNGRCKPETVDKYVRIFVDKFTESSTYDKQMLYLQGLNNIEMGQVLDFMEPVIRGNVSDLSGSSSHHIRFLAVWATMNTALRSPGRVYALYWPILTNASEHLELRVAALTMLMTSLDSPARYWSLYWYIRSHSNNHLYNYFYTTIHSLAHSKHPCYAQLTQVAAQLMRLVPEPEDRTWPTGNYITDYEHPGLGLGGLLQLVLIGSERTFQPSVVFLSAKKHASQRLLVDFAVYVKLQGVSEAAQAAFMKVDPLNMKIPQLADLLRSIRVSPRDPEPVHVEFLLMREGRVVLCYHINNSFNSLNKLKEKATTLLSQFHVNAQRLWFPVQLEMTQPTQLGTAAAISLSSSVIGSLRGDFTQETDAKSIIRHNRLDVRLSVGVETVLQTFNPVSEVWHGVDRSLGFHGQIPFVSNISFDMKNLHLSLGPLNETVGSVGHLRSGVFVQGPAAQSALYIHCNKCLMYHTVGSQPKSQKSREVLDLRIEEIGAKLHTSLFDCDRPYTTLDYGKLAVGLLDPHHHNYQMVPGRLPLLGIVHLVDIALVQAPRGSCGIISTLRTIGSRNTELHMAVQAATEVVRGDPSETLPGEKRMVRVALSHRERGSEVPLHQIDVSAVHERFTGHARHDLKMKLTRTANGTQTSMMCMEADWNMPPWHPDLIPLSDTITGNLNAVWGRSSAGGFCPRSGSSVSLKAKAEATMEQLALATTAASWPYDQCKRDSLQRDEWGETFTPLTPACQEEARQLATLRKYTATLKYSNLPEKLVALSQRVGGVLELLRPLKREDAREELTAVVEFPVKEPIVNVTLNSRDLSLDYSSLGFVPLLYNARFPRPNTNLGLVSSCIVTTARVITWDNATVWHNLSQCYTLAAADCSRHPKFALFMRRVAGPKPLAVKLYTGGNYVELAPDATGKVNIKINDKPVPNAIHGFAYPMQDTFYSFKVWEKPGGLYEVESRMSYSWLQYYGHSALFMLGPGLYSGNTCGLCGDLNSNAANDYNNPIHIELCSVPNDRASTLQ